MARQLGAKGVILSDFNSTIEAMRLGGYGGKSYLECIEAMEFSVVE